MLINEKTLCNYLNYKGFMKKNVGVTGFEPATSRPPDERATGLRYTPSPAAFTSRKGDSRPPKLYAKADLFNNNGGHYWIRTSDLCSVKAAL